MSWGTLALALLAEAIAACFVIAMKAFFYRRRARIEHAKTLEEERDGRWMEVTLAGHGDDWVRLGQYESDDGESFCPTLVSSGFDVILVRSNGEKQHVDGTVSLEESVDARQTSSTEELPAAIVPGAGYREASRTAEPARTITRYQFEVRGGTPFLLQRTKEGFTIRIWKPSAWLEQRGRARSLWWVPIPIAGVMALFGLWQNTQVQLLLVGLVIAIPFMLLLVAANDIDVWMLVEDPGSSAKKARTIAS